MRIPLFLYGSIIIGKILKINSRTFLSFILFFLKIDFLVAPHYSKKESIKIRGNYG